MQIYLFKNLVFRTDIKQYKHEVKANNLEEAMEWVRKNLDNSYWWRYWDAKSNTWINVEHTFWKAKVGKIYPVKKSWMPKERELRQEKLFKTKEEARKEASEKLKIYEEAEKKAKPILDEVEDALRKILKSNNCELSYYIDGDLYGIHEDYLYISTEIDSYTIIRKID